MPEQQTRTWGEYGLEMLKTAVGWVSPDAAKAINLFQTIQSAGRQLDASPKTQEAAKEAEQVAEAGREDRTTYLGELARSMYLRQLPGLATAGYDLTRFLFQEKFGTKDPSEAYAYQHEVEAILALARIAPDFLKKPLIEPLMIDSLKTVILNWPGIAGLAIFGNDPEAFKKRIEEKEPNAWIDAIRIIHQDIVTGIVGYQKFMAAMQSAGISLQNLIPGLSSASTPAA